MKKSFYIFLAIILGICSFTSCDRERVDFGQDNRPTGTVDLTSISINVNAAPEPTRAGGPNLDNFKVTIEEVTSAGNTEVRAWAYRDMPEVFKLPVGNYVVVVTSAQEEPLATFDGGFWKGEQAFTIVEKAVTSIETVNCMFRSIKVAVAYSDDLKALLGNDVKVTLTLEGSGSLEFPKAEERAGYLKAVQESNVLKAHLTGTIEGDKVDYETAFPNVKAGEYRIIKYNLKSVDNGDTETGGTSNFKLKVDATCEIVEENITVTPEGEEGTEDFPNGNDGGDEPGGGEQTEDLPRIEGASINGVPFDIKETHTIEGECELIVKMYAPLGITHVNVTIDSETLTEDILTGVGLSKSFDLAEPGSLADALSGLGFPVKDKVINQKELVFDITSFTSLLGIYGAATHKFIINVVDNSNNSVTETLTLISK